MKKGHLLLLSVLLSLFIGLFIGREVFPNSNNSSCVSKLKFIKSNLDCDFFDSKAESLSSLQNKVEVLIDGFKKTGKVKRVSVFVRDLKTSRFVGVNDNDVYYMASLLKTPLLIGGYKLAEVEPRILEQEIKYTGVPNLYDEQEIKSEDVLKVGMSYSIKELMRRSVVYSDNTAAQILFDYYPQEFMDRIMQALGIQITKPTGEVENLITARTYAGIFRILYNAAYLTKEYSDEALSTLTEVSFNQGATSKLPKETVVAHKFAERTEINGMGNVATRQFHECGIVYQKKSDEPYTFCIMTEGKDYKDLEEVVSIISLTLYEEMVNKWKF